MHDLHRSIMSQSIAKRLMPLRPEAIVNTCAFLTFEFVYEASLVSYDKMKLFTREWKKTIIMAVNWQVHHRHHSTVCGRMFFTIGSTSSESKHKKRGLDGLSSLL